jgi:hypothetical protein
MIAVPDDTLDLLRHFRDSWTATLTSRSEEDKKAYQRATVILRDSDRAEVERLIAENDRLRGLLVLAEQRAEPPRDAAPSPAKKRAADRRRKDKGEIRKRRGVSPETAREWLELHEKGDSYAAIGRAYGFHPDTIRWHVTKLRKGNGAASERQVTT